MTMNEILSLTALVSLLTGVGAPAFAGGDLVVSPGGLTLAGARDRIRAERKAGDTGPRTVRIAAGTYCLEETLAFGPEDSDVAYVADGDVTVTGSRRLGKWTVEADGSWSVPVDWVKPDRTGGFRMLRVGGEPRPRARLPKKGYYEVVNDDLPPKTRYNAPRPCAFLKPEEFRFDWRHIEDLEMVVYHFWTDSHLRIASTDPASNKVTFVTACGKAFDTGWSNNKSGGLRGIYVLENFPAAMTEPGEWWLDHAGKTLHYLPKPGERPDTSVAEVPFVRTLVAVDADPAKDGRFADGLVFRGIRFTLSQFELTPDNVNGAQASAKVEAAVRLAGARRCRFEKCRFEDLSGYAVDMLAGTRECALARCTLTRLGAGGVRMNGGTAGCHPYALTSGNVVEDCEIGPYGLDFRSAVGVLVMNAEKSRIVHNHIFDGWYTGVSVGWVWGYAESVSRHNVIAHNHIHQIGQGCLSDMGGVYMLGPSCGTVVANNRIHDVDARSYGGWGIYNDEGSTGILIENNVVYDTKFAGYDIHYAQDLLVRNNIFAFGRKDQLARTRQEKHVSCTLLNNIVYWNEGRLFSGNWNDAAEPFPELTPPRKPGDKPRLSTVTFRADANVYFNPNAAVTNVVFGNGKTFEQWRKMGKDRKSVYADPLFVDPDARDFRLKPDSPARRLGFVDFDQSDVGPRPEKGALLPDSPARVTAAGEGFTNELAFADGAWRGAGVAVTLSPDGRVRIASPDRGLSWVRLDWRKAWPAGAIVLPDAWERTYGELEWHRIEAKERNAPWYFLVTADGVTDGYGIETQPNALACWKVSTDGVALRLDVRAGGQPVLLGARTLEAVRVVTRKGRPGERAFAAGQAFCRMMCPKPRLPKVPFYGYNDWYCAYGKNTATNFLADAAYIMECAKGCANQPYVVMDDGWQRNSPPVVGGSGRGPWDAAGPMFGMDMPTFCAKIAALGARPGLWYRPFNAWAELPKDWRLREKAAYLDPTVPAVRKQIFDDVSRFRSWGFKLVKIDYLTYDLCHQWGYAMGDSVFRDGSATWRDRSRTSCEVLRDLYGVMREAAGEDVIILGCNALNHLAAGLFEMQRIGDDTSGRRWETTLHKGVNTLGFRCIQDRTFFAADADCVGLATAGAVPWEKNRQWLDLVARSGTPLFVSWHRSLADAAFREALGKAFRTASEGPATGEPLDWTEGKHPARWRFADGEATYAW